MEVETYPEREVGTHSNTWGEEQCRIPPSRQTRLSFGSEYLG